MSFVETGLSEPCTCVYEYFMLKLFRETEQSHSLLSGFLSFQVNKVVGGCKFPKISIDTEVVPFVAFHYQ